MLNQSIIRGGTSPSSPTNKSTMEDLYKEAKASSTKIQSLIAEESNEKKLTRLLELNDLVNLVIANYESFKAGKPMNFNNTSAAPSKSPSKAQQGNSLIDFDEPAPQTSHAPSPGSKAPSPGTRNVLDDLSDLNFTVSH
jgi:hypothetical protein